MVFFCIGMPSRFDEWCRAVTARLVERALGPVAETYADTPEQFLSAVLTAEKPYLVAGSSQIVGQLWIALAEANKPFILVLDHPHHAIEHFVVRHGAEFLEATRTVAKSCASVVSCAALPGALVLDAERDSVDLPAAAAAIARHFGLAVDETGIADAVTALGDFDLRSDPQEHRAWWQGLAEEQRALVAGAVDPYLARLAGRDPAPLTWARDLFFMNEEPSSGEIDPPALRPIDITGRQRHIFHGPYITLPPGAWSATIALGFSAEAAELSYRVEVCGGMGIALDGVSLPPGQERVVELALNFSLTAPDLIDIHILNERAAFDGRLAVGHAVITPVGGIRPETRSYLETALAG
ncbi:MAG: hypothetical protein ACREE4_11385 [Stellaceae bacterium]